MTLPAGHGILRMAWRCRLVVAAALIIACPAPAGSQFREERLPPDPQAERGVQNWEWLLNQYVKDGLVDYAGLLRDRLTLHHYLVHVSQVNVSALSREAQLAFWINAYNACVVDGVVDYYPLTTVQAIRGFFDGTPYPVAGRQMTLDEIEGAARALDDWRVHFALACASSSCPPLRAEAYEATRLEAQLTEQTRTFLADPTRGLRLDGSTVWVSKIFDWYTTDFVAAAAGGRRRRLTANALLSVLKPYLRPAALEAAAGKTLRVKFLPYDWALNDQPQEE